MIEFIAAVALMYLTVTGAWMLVSQSAPTQPGRSRQLMDTFPFETWEEASTAAVETGVGYFTFGPGGNTATYVLVALGFVVMVVTLSPG